MLTRTLRTTVAPDGTVNLHLDGLPAGEIEVVVVVNQAAPATNGKAVPAAPEPPTNGHAAAEPTWFDDLMSIVDDRRKNGGPLRTKEEIDRDLREMRDEWDEDE